MVWRQHTQGVTWGESFGVSGPQFSHLKIGKRGCLGLSSSTLELFFISIKPFVIDSKSHLNVSVRGHYLKLSNMSK